MKFLLSLGLLFCLQSAWASEAEVALKWMRGEVELGEIELKAGYLFYSTTSHQQEKLLASACHLNRLGQWQRKLLQPKFSRAKKCPKDAKAGQFVEIKTGKLTSLTSDCAPLLPSYQEVLASLLACK